MASYDSFRVRRSVDPKPIHYGSFPRESRNTSSLNDLDAAWENVDEARSALQAVEARIQEANFGLRNRRIQESNLNEPAVREVFSQNQRLGRVSRYELRPTVNELQYPRESERSPRQISSTRKITPSSYTTSYSKYGGSIDSARQHSPPSRDRKISPEYINNTINNSEETDLSLQRNLDFNRTRDVDKNSRVIDSSSFSDNNEVSSVKRKKLNGLKPLSPLSSISDKSDALARLKERIQKQKEKTPAPKQKENEDSVVNKIQSSFEERPAIIQNEESYVKPVCKRKVVAAPPPTGYKGFSIPNTVPVSSKEKDSRPQSRDSSYAPSTKAGQKRSSVPQKPNQSSNGKTSKGGVKMRRITAPRAPMDFITPYSWRTGMETVKKVLGPSNTRPKSSASSRPQSTVSQDTTSTASRMGIREWENEKRDEHEKKSAHQEKPVKPEENGFADDTALSDGLLSEGLLSEDAKNVLSDLDLDSDKSDEEEGKLTELKPKQERIPTKNAPKVKSPPTKKSKTFIKKKIPPKQKSPDTMPPKSIIQRHYDVDKVKKYMEKKIKDRKQKLREEKKMKQEAVDGRKKRLETLYNKQKKILATNLNQNSSKCKLGETHSVIPGHFTFQHQQIGYLPEFFSQESESEKEGTDVASFNGLPTPSPRGHQMSSSSEHHSDQISDVSSDLSLQSLNESHSRLPNTKEEEETDNQADVTLTPGESSYTESRALNGEMGRNEREEEIAYPRIPSNPVQLSSRTHRIEALKNTAADLKNRLEQEARRLGLTMLEKAEVEPLLPSKGVTLKEPDVFRGNLPGVSNLHEQAELNDTLDSMNSAATRIQAVYRGYSTRQGLNWKLPSGQTLGGIIRNAPRRTPVEGRAESIPLYLASDTSSDTHLSDVETAYSHESDRSLHSRTRKPGSMLESRSSSASHRLQTKGPASTSFSTGHYRPSTTLGKTLTDTKGDRMSVINIYLRNLSSLRQGQEERFLDSEKKDEDNDTGSLYSDDFNLDKSSDPGSLIHDDEDLKDGSLDLDRTLVKESPPRESPLRESPSKESPLRDSIELEQHLENVRHSPSVDRSFSHSGSSHGSPTESLSLSQTDTEYSPIRPSERSPSPSYDVRGSSTHPGQPTSRYHPPLYYPSHQGGDRMSPGSLDQRMLAELNRLEFMEESVRQLTDIERTNAVSLAQQETVSLAQILKAKQATYAKEMEALQIKAQKEKQDAARELDEARYSAKKSSLDAQETVAKVKAEAADNIVQSTDRLVKAQTEAARVTTDSAKKVEEARKEAARTLLAAANHQVNDVREVASSAASAAAQEAVRTTLEQFRQELRPSRKYDTSHSTPDSRSRGSYSRDSYSDERSPSYSRSRSSRIATEKESSASKANDGGGYTSDEFESFKESETAKSVRTASPDRTYVSNHDSLVQDRERSGTKSSESIAEEVDASVSEGSIASDSIIANKSIDEAVNDHKDQTNHEYSMTFEESMVSSRNVTDDEMDYRLILPSEGHRRRSIGKTQRSGSVCSDAVSYSSDENLDKHLSESVHEKNTPFSGEDSFSKFTADMVKLMREEEVRAKHLEALLHLREKALKENTKAEMEWLELQKKQMRDKGADDAMPFIKKRQRDVIKRLKTEKAEIKYLMAAHRAARYDRRLMMMNQEEITRLRRSTHKIRGKVREEEGSRDKTKSDVQEDISSPHTRRSTPVSTGRPQDESPSKSTTVPEEISAIDSPTADTSFPTYENESAISDRARKRSLSEGESDDGAASGSATRSKGSPSTSDSIVMQQLKKLKSQSSERYLTQREQKLMRRKHEGEDLSDRKLIEWERRLDEEDDKRNDKNRIKSKRAVKATQNRLKEEDLAAMAPDRSREGSIPEVDYVSKDFSEASDHSDVETRVRELREQLQQREQEVRRLHKEQKRQKRAMLHEEEENLRKKLQAVERILQKTKENLERPSTTSKPEAAVTKPPPVIKASIETIPDELSLNESTVTQSRPFTSRDPSSIKEEATDKLRASPSNSSISESLSLKKSTPEEHSTPDSKQTKKSSFSDGPFKGINVVLDLDFSSKDRQGDEEPQSISDVKDLDISDRSGVFDKEDDYTPFSQSEEIKDIAPTPEDISQASEIQTISERSGIEELSRSQSLQSPEIPSKRSGVESQNFVRELSEKQASQEDSISEAISARSSKRSGTESISEAISARSSKRSGTESISEALSLRSAQRSESESVPESLAAKSKSEEVLGSRSKSPVNEYSNTFESEQNKDETDDDISEQIIEEEEETGVANKEGSPKSYTSDFEPSESNIPSNVEFKDRSGNNTSLYSQDFEAPSTYDKLEQPSLEKSVRGGQPEEGDEPEVLTQHRLSQATDEESIAEEILEEENKSASLSDANQEAGPLDEQKDVPNISSSKDIAHEENYSQYSQDFESPSSPKLSISLSRGEEPGQKADGHVSQLDDASEEKSIAEEIPEDQVSVESGTLSEASDEATPRFSLSEQKSIGKDKSVTLSEAEKLSEKFTLEEKDQSQYSQDFESSSSHQNSKQPSAEEKLGEADRIKKYDPEPDMISPQRRLSDATDDESVAEELPEEQHSLESGHLSEDDKHSQLLVGVPTEKSPDHDALSPSKSENDISSHKDVDEEAVLMKPFVDKDEFRRQQADKIALDLSSTLVSDAVTCISNLYEDHKLKGSATPQSDEKTAQSSKPDSLVDVKLDSDKEDSMNEWGKPPEEGFEISEGEDLSISERLSFTDDEGSLPLLDLKPRDTASQKDKVVSPVQAIEEKESPKPEIDKKAENEQILKDLSENLLKEAASKMISLMRQKQAKLKTLEQTQKVDKKELPISPPPYSPELSPRGFDKFMAVMKQASQPGSPTKNGGPIDSNELTDKLSQLKLLHDEIGSHLGDDDDDDDDFVINANKPLELPTDKEEYGPPSGQTIPLVVPHNSDDVIPIVSTSLATFYQRKKSGGSLASVTPPPEFSESNVDETDPDSKVKQSYRRMIFDITGEVFRDVLNEESPVDRPSWMKPRRRRKNRFYHALSPVTDEHDYLPIVQQRVLDLVGLGSERPNIDTLRRKTPLKLGKKDFVDAVLIQELREEEPQWVDYDDDELAVKFQVADAILESLMSETIMVLNAVQRRKESMSDVT